MKIGVLSDTHISTRAKKLPDRIIKEFSDVDLIVHAGDFIEKDVLNCLEKIAPVKAVSGNMDSPELKNKLPERLEFELNGYKIGVAHGHNLRGHLMIKLAYIFPAVDIIIFGHTHQPFNKKIGDVLYFNPGSPTDRRLQPYYSFGIIKLGEKIESEIIQFK